MAVISVTVRPVRSHPAPAITGLPGRAHSTRRLNQITRPPVSYRADHLHGRFSMASAQYYDVTVYL